MRGWKKIKVDIVAPPFSGHLYPLLEMIGSLINDERYDICVYTGIQKEEVVESLGIKCKVVLKDRPTIFEDIANTPEKTDIIALYKQFKENMKIIPQIINDLKEEFEKRNTDIVIADFTAVPAGIACNKLNIPWITTMPTPFAIENKSTTPGYLGGWYPKSNMFYKIRDSIGRAVIRNFKRLVCLTVSKELKAFDFRLYNKNGEEMIYSPYSILAIGMKELEFRDDFPERFLWAGPCSPSFDKKNYSFMNTSKFKKTVFLCNGTHVLWAKEKIVKIAEKLGNEYPEICFIVSSGDYTKKDEDIKKISENVFVYKYIDYEAVFPHIDYVIHHGGAGIMYKAIKYNKPAVIIPHDYDQFDYAVRAEMADIAFIANLKSEKSIKTAFQKMLERKEWKNLEKIHKNFENYLPTEILKNEIDRLLTEKLSKNQEK